MVYAAGDLHIDAQVTFGGFMDAHLLADIHLEVNDARTNLHAEMTNDTSTYWFGTDGDGFINCAFLMWDPQPVRQYTRISLPESWPNVDAELRRGLGSKYPNDVMWGVYASDDYATGHQPQGLIKNPTHDFVLSGGDFNPDGSMKSRDIVGYIGRAYWDKNLKPEIPDAFDASIHNDLGMFRISLDSFQYFPWSVRSGGGYRSCNRDGGYVQRRAGSYVDRRNNPMGQSTVYLRQGGSWTISPKTGS